MLNIDEDIVIPVYNGKRGHPLLMKSYLVNKLLSNNSYKTLRDFISINKTAFLNVNDLGILMDIDTIEDYSEISKLYMVGD